MVMGLSRKRWWRRKRMRWWWIFSEKNKFKRVICSTCVSSNEKVNDVAVQRINVQVFTVYEGLTQYPNSVGPSPTIYS